MSRSTLLASGLYSRDDRSVANEFNRFFTSVGRGTVDKIDSLASQCNYDRSKSVFVPRKHPEANQFNFKPVECSEVASVVWSMPLNKSPGIDKIPARVIKDSLPAVLLILTSVINASFATGIFPCSWKMAEVSPILKDGDFEEPNNYRPISLLPIMSKICERIALNQLMPYLLSNERLSATQSGNKKFHSTETSLIHTTEAILGGIDKRKVTTVVLLDMSKAFDSINHEILQQKLQDVGISSSGVTWFNSYLSQRHQIVRINNELSEPLPVDSGVPQGSILGPLLFSIYMSDLPSVFQHCQSESYVDDTKIYISFPIQDRADAIFHINDDLLKIRNWCFDNYLLLNPDKTKLMISGSRQLLSKLPDVRLSLMGKEFTPEKVVKDLGVTFDPNLTFYDHILKTVSSCMSSLAQINRVKYMFDKNTLMIVINALVFSKLFYCSSVWSNAATTHLLKLQAVQNFAARIVSNTRKFDHVTPVLKDLRWLPVKSQRYYRDAVLAFKCMTGQAPAYLSTPFLIRAEISGRETRNPQLLNVPLFKTTTGQRTFFYRTVSLWNSLETNLKLSESLDIFKRRLRGKLLREFLSS